VIRQESSPPYFCGKTSSSLPLLLVVFNRVEDIKEDGSPPRGDRDHLFSSCRSNFSPLFFPSCIRIADPDHCKIMGNLPFFSPFFFLEQGLRIIPISLPFSLSKESSNFLFFFLTRWKAFRPGFEPGMISMITFFFQKRGIGTSGRERLFFFLQHRSGGGRAKIPSSPLISGDRSLLVSSSSLP